MPRRTKLAPSIAKPVPHKTFRLILITYQGVKMFYDPVSGRATDDLRSGMLPYETTLELWRDGKQIAEAKHKIIGGPHDMTDTFDGTRPLVRSERYDEELVRRGVFHQKGHVYGGIILSRSKDFHPNDEIVLHLPTTPHPFREERTVDGWFAHATRQDRDAVVEYRRERDAWKKIERTIHEKAFDAFWNTFHEKPWREALQAAEAMTYP